MNDAFVTLLKKANKVLITTHKSPDGDAVGSSVAFAHFLKSFGKQCLVLLPDLPAGNLSSFLEDIPYVVYDEFHQNESEFDLMMCLDYNHTHRVGEDMEAIVANWSIPKVMIDHHPNPTEFCDVIISRPEVCSTAQLLFEVLEECKLSHHLNKNASEAIYLGIMTDTGSFRFPSVSSKTHDVLKKILENGVEAHKIHEKVFDESSKEKVLLRAYAISNKFHQIPHTPIGYISLTQEELSRFNYKKGDTEGLVNVPLSIKGISISVFMMENEEGKVKMSFRSKGSFYVNEFASKYFNGGGHKYAAGGFSHDDIGHTIQKLIAESSKLVK